MANETSFATRAHTHIHVPVVRVRLWLGLAQPICNYVFVCVWSVECGSINLMKKFRPAVSFLSYFYSNFELKFYYARRISVNAAVLISWSSARLCVRHLFKTQQRALIDCERVCAQRPHRVQRFYFSTLFIGIASLVFSMLQRAFGHHSITTEHLFCSIQRRTSVSRSHR